jgi:hypothetical protein
MEDIWRNVVQILNLKNVSSNFSQNMSSSLAGGTQKSTTLGAGNVGANA